MTDTQGINLVRSKDAPGLEPRDHVARAAR